MGQRLKFYEPVSPEFELVFYPKDRNGNPSIKPKSIKSSHGYDLWQAWQSNQGPRQNKKKKKSKQQRYKEVLPKGKQVEGLIKEVAKYAETKQQQRDDKSTQ
jgi:hypothetical protein